MTEYMNEQTKMPSYAPFPRFLFQAKLSSTAMVVYALLLDRASLSRANGWKNEFGAVYIIFPIVRIAEEIGKSTMTVKNALKELEIMGLLERKKQGTGRPNRIYIKFPVETTVERKLSTERKENCLSEGKKTIHHEERKISPNNINRTNNTSATELSTVHGRYQNIHLTGEEYQRLQEEFPLNINQLIEEMSGYLAAEGKTYANYAAALRRWGEKRKNTVKQAIPDYSCKEGESL